MAEGRLLSAEGRPLTAESRPPMASPIFADDPLGAIALAETMGELPRPLNWVAPNVDAAVRFMRAFLAGRRLSEREWPKRAFRLGRCIAIFEAEEKEWFSSVEVRILIPPDLTQLDTGWTLRAALSNVPYVGIEMHLSYAFLATRELDVLIVHLDTVEAIEADIPADLPSLHPDIRALAQEVGVDEEVDADD